MEIGTKVILALNMMDEAKNRKIEINVNELSKILHIPVVATVAPKKEAIILSDKSENTSFKIEYGKDIENEIKLIREAFLECAAVTQYHVEWTALKLIENDQYVIKYLDQIDNGKIINDKAQKSIENLITIIGYEAAIKQSFTPLTALVFMVMTLLYVPCVATIGTIKQETNSTKWAVVSEQ